MDPDPDPAIFVGELQDVNNKKQIQRFFFLLLFEGTFTSFFKVKKQKESMFFLLFLLDDRKIRIRISD
jgi:hypothetical protein